MTKNNDTGGYRSESLQSLHPSMAVVGGAVLGASRVCVSHRRFPL